MASRHQTALIFLIALISFACGSKGGTSLGTPGPNSPATPVTPNAPSSQTPVFRSLNNFIGCGTVTPGTCQEKNYQLTLDAVVTETNTNHSAHLSGSDYNNIVTLINQFWTNSQTEDYHCVEPDQPIVGGHEESTTMVIGNPTVPVYVHQATGAECARGDVTKARSVHNYVRDTIAKYF